MYEHGLQCTSSVTCDVIQCHGLLRHMTVYMKLHKQMLVVLGDIDLLLPSQYLGITMLLLEIKLL